MISRHRRSVRPDFALLSLICCLMILHPVAAADAAEDPAATIKANYTKYEQRIPMRDGARLFTSIYVPKDESRTYGIMLQRTPYSVRPYGVDNYPEGLGPSERFAEEGFIFVYQDVRGRYMSEGRFIEMTPHRVDKREPEDVDESTDTHDTIEWLVQNVPGNNGRVGTWGISYPGFFVAAGMIDAHPALKAASPQAPVTDLFMGDDAYHNGAFYLAANFGFLTFFVEHKEPRLPGDFEPFEYGTRDGYEFFLELGPLSQVDEKHFNFENPYWTDLVEHTTYDDFWRSRNIAAHLDHLPPAVMTVGGWFDAEDLAGPLNVFHSIERRKSGISNHLVMGPWAHGAWARTDGDQLGDVRFNSKTAEFYRDEIEFPFFDRHLNGPEDEGDHLRQPKAWVFETGTHRWRKFDAWPPDEAEFRRLYFRAAGTLSFDAPTEEQAVDQYLSDPAKPVPFVESITRRMPKAYMVGDQRFASKRPDVRVYRTEPLTEDLAVAGPLSVDLWVSTTGSDSDFVVKLIDVYPDEFPEPDPNPREVEMGGYQQLVRGEPFRAKFRNSMQQPEAMVPNELTRLQFEMPDIAHVFRRGHRVMVQVQSTWFPLVDRNPQTFVDIPFASSEEFRPATQRISRSREKSSSIGLRVIRSGPRPVTR